MRPGVQLTALRRAWRSVDQAVLIVCFLIQAAVQDQVGAAQLRYITRELDALIAEHDELHEHTKVFRRNWLLQAIRE